MGDYFHLGIVYIPISLIGGTINLTALYCLIKYRSRNITNFGNHEKLLTTLSFSDLFFCLVTLPLKIVTFMVNAEMETRPIYILYTTMVSFWSSTLLIVLIASNQYIIVSRPGKVVPKKHIMFFIVLTQVYSITGPAIIFANVKIAVLLNASLSSVILITLPVLYVLIFRKMRSSRRKTQPQRVRFQKNFPNEITKAGSTRRDCSNINKMEIVEIETTCLPNDPNSFHQSEADNQNKIKENPEDIQIMQSPQAECNDENKVATNQPNDTNSSTMTKAERRVIKSTLILLAVFFGCCLAGLCLAFIYIISGKQEKLDPVRYGALIFSFRAIINPVIYVFKNRTYREPINNLLPRCLRRRTNTVNPL